MKTNKHGEAHKVEIIDKNLNMQSSEADVPAQRKKLRAIMWSKVNAHQPVRSPGVN